MIRRDLRLVTGDGWKTEEKFVARVPHTPGVCVRAAGKGLTRQGVCKSGKQRTCREGFLRFLRTTGAKRRSMTDGAKVKAKTWEKVTGNSWSVTGGNRYALAAERGRSPMAL